MDRSDIQAFVQRSRLEIEKSKREFWARQFREQGPAATLRVGHVLFEHARMVQPRFLSGPERARDLAHHIVLKRLLDRVGHELPDR